MVHERTRGFSAGLSPGRFRRTIPLRQPDITLARKLLGWEPKASRAEGLKITYGYFKSLSPDELHEKEHDTIEGYVRR